MTRRVSIRLAFGGGLVWLASALAAVAHPDIAVTARLLFDFRQERLVSFAERFAFDAAYSARLTARFDTDADGSFDAGETEALRQRLIADLKSVGFFTELSQGGRSVSLPAPTAFHAVISAGIVIVTFGFPVEQGLDLQPGRDLSVMLRDRDYTAAFKLASERPVVIRGADGRCVARIEDRPDEAYFGRLVVPQAVVLSCR